MPPNPLNVECSIALDSSGYARDTRKSTASLRYLEASGKWKELRDQPVKVVWVPITE